MHDKLYDIVTMGLYILAIVLLVTFVSSIFSGILDLLTVLTTIGTEFVVWLLLYAAFHIGSKEFGGK